jgi:hypothetical protein
MNNQRLSSRARSKNDLARGEGGKIEHGVLGWEKCNAGLYRNGTAR